MTVSKELLIYVRFNGSTRDQMDRGGTEPAAEYTLFCGKRMKILN
jgi:hypothetical protein